MPHLTVSELQELRRWRTRLLAVAAVLQGLQYVLRPTLPLTTRSYRSLDIMGELGWTIFGVALMVFAAAVVALPARRVWAAFYLGALLYSMLVAANILSGVIPGLLLLPAGLCLGEVRAHAWQKIRRER